MADGAERLRCYDGVARNAGLVIAQPVQAPAVAAALWDIKKSISQIDDSQRVVVAQKADRALSTWGYGDPPTFAVRCQEGVVSLMLSAGQSFSKETSVTWRLDQERAFEQTWHSADAQQGIVLDGDLRDVAQLIVQLASHKQLVMRVVAPGSSPIIVAFHLDGLTDKVKDVWRACGVNPQVLAPIGATWKTKDPNDVAKYHVPTDAHGAILTDVQPDMPAQKAGLRVGDLIVAVDGQALQSAEDMSLAIQKAGAALPTLVFQVYRGAIAHESIAVDCCWQRTVPLRNLEWQMR